MAKEEKDKQYICTFCNTKSRIEHYSGKIAIDHRDDCKYFIATKGDGIVEIKKGQ